MELGKLTFEPLRSNKSLAAKAVTGSLSGKELEEVLVAKTDPEMADTENFCKHYDIGLDVSANCVVLKAKRADRTWYVALMIMATDRADVNKTVKKHVNARKLSFAPMDEAVELTNMEYGGITPIGMPENWQILVDTKVAKGDHLIIGSGTRGSKMLVRGEFLASLPNAEVVGIAIEEK